MFTSFLTLLGSSVTSVFVPGLPEVLAVVYAEKLHWSPSLVALFMAFGQCISFAALYVFGEWLLARWGWLRRHVERVQQRYAYHLERRFLTVSGFAGIFSVPPAIAISVLAPGFLVRFRHLMPLFFVTRVVRFAAMIYGGHRFNAWVHWL